MELYARIRRAVMIDGLSRREAVWRSPQHNCEDASVFGPARLLAPGTSGLEDSSDRTWRGSTRSLKGSQRSQEAAPHGKPDIRAAAGRTGIFRRLYDCAVSMWPRQRCGHSTEPPTGSCPGRFWRSRRLHRRQEGAVSLFLHRPAATRTAVSSRPTRRDGGSLL